MIDLCQCPFVDVLVLDQFVGGQQCMPASGRCSPALSLLLLYFRAASHSLGYLRFHHPLSAIIHALALLPVLLTTLPLIT
jgi:hypothetical protein